MASEARETKGGWPGDGWVPTRSIATDPPVLEWSWLGERRTDAPLFEDSVREALADPINRMPRPRTSLDALIAGMADADTVPLSGFIFHMSRCGSTLLARMLGAPPHHLVASEPEPLDAVIQWAETANAPYERKLQAIRAIAAALGRRRDPAWTRLFIKLDSWHILSHRLLGDAFPDVPWVFLHRDPVEVLVSLAAMPGSQAVPGMLPEALIGIENANHVPQDEYAAMVLARFCEAAIEAHSSGGGMIVDYADLIPAALDAIPSHFGFTPGAAEDAAMAAASKDYSKNPADIFAADSAIKLSSANVRVKGLAQIHLKELSKRLQALGHM